MSPFWHLASCSYNEGGGNTDKEQSAGRKRDDSKAWPILIERKQKVDVTADDTCSSQKWNPENRRRVLSTEAPSDGIKGCACLKEEDRDKERPWCWWAAALPPLVSPIDPSTGVAMATLASPWPHVSHRIILKENSNVNTAAGAATSTQRRGTSAFMWSDCTRVPSFHRRVSTAAYRRNIVYKRCETLKLIKCFFPLQENPFRNDAVYNLANPEQAPVAEWFDYLLRRYTCSRYVNTCLWHQLPYNPDVCRLHINTFWTHEYRDSLCRNSLDMWHVGRCCFCAQESLGRDVDSEWIIPVQ